MVQDPKFDLQVLYMPLPALPDVRVGLTGLTGCELSVSFSCKITIEVTVSKTRYLV